MSVKHKPRLSGTLTEEDAYESAANDRGLGWQPANINRELMRLFAKSCWTGSGSFEQKLTCFAIIHNSCFNRPRIAPGTILSRAPHSPDGKRIWSTDRGCVGSTNQRSPIPA